MLMQCHKISAMSQQKPPLIVTISSSLSTEIFDCGIDSNRQMNVYVLRNVKVVKLNSVTFHSGISTQTLRSAIQDYMF